MENGNAKQFSKKRAALVSLALLFLFGLQTFVSSASTPQLFPNSNVTSSSNAEMSSSSSPPLASGGAPLLPGSVNSINTWNTSQTLACPLSHHYPSQPLVAASGGSWTLSLNIPTFLFMNKPVGQNVTQNYALYNNGTFVVSDSAGNSFGWNAPSGLPSGSLTTSFVANSSEALQTYTVSNAGSNVASMSVSYSIYYQNCQPRGIEMTIKGNANWGSNVVSGALSLSFIKASLWVNGTTAWFGNSSGTMLGLDWSQSRSYAPVFDSASRTLSYSVGNNFTIDPVTVSSFYIQPGSQGYSVFYNNGNYWTFLDCGYSLSFDILLIKFEWNQLEDPDCN